MFSGVRGDGGGGRFLEKAPQKLFWKNSFWVDCLWILFVRLLIGYFGCAVDAYCRWRLGATTPSAPKVSLCKI